MDLTKPQKLIYDMEKFAGGAIGIICGCFLINGKCSVEKIKEASNELYRKNDALRIRIQEKDFSTQQTVLEYSERDFEVLYFDSKKDLDSYAEDYSKKPFDFYGILCDMKIVILKNQFGLLVKLHHIISDAWTLALMATQFYKLISGEDFEAFSYFDYVESEKKYLESKRYSKDREYYVSKFNECDEPTYLNEKHSSSFLADRITFVIDKEKTELIKKYIQEKNISFFSLYMAVLSVYINKIKMNPQKFYIGTAVLNRMGNKEKNTMGMYVNTVPMLVETLCEASFCEHVLKLQQDIKQLFFHQKFNYGDVLKTLREKSDIPDGLYDVMVSYQNAAISSEGCETMWYHNGAQNESLQIHIDDRDNEGIFRINYDYLVEKFSECEINNLHQHLFNLLFDAIANDTKKLYELCILSNDEKQKLLFDFNNTQNYYPKDKCVHQLFEEQVLKTPDRIAVIACDKTLTYKELNEQSNKIAHSLIQKGVGVGDIVAFALSRKSHLIATMLGILKCGAAYLPVDPDYPKDRIEYILNDSKAKLFITEDNVEELFCNECVVNPQNELNSENLCYCIYTSGSTGAPKGTLLKHRGIVNLVTNLKIYSNISKCERIGFMTTITFDVATQEIFTSLLNGFTGVLVTERKETRSDLIIDSIIQNKIDIMYATPTYFDSLTDTKEKAEKLLSFIKVVCLAGEKFYLNKNVLEIKDNYNVVFENQYGPVELHVIATTQTYDNDFESIGKPIGNNKAYIVDKYMQITPVGVTGELCIAGDGVGVGYLNRPKLTAEKFIDNPFGEGKLYKTGDLAYWREDGNIVYAGRNDFQVKIRGLRIELGEIENAICCMDGISQAVVVVRKNNDGRQLICAFYTGEVVEAKEIRDYIGKKLPKYMLPHVFTHLDVMPLTSSGKINRKALPAIEIDNIANVTEYVAPETKLQKEICKLIEAVLATTPVGIMDDFFDMGGDSLKAIEFVSKAHNEGIYFNLQNVFDYPIVKHLCECIENGDKQVISFDDVDFSEINGILEKNKVKYIVSPQKSDVGNVLLAGATGYLGIHILANFLDNDKGVAYCLVRGKDEKDSKKRFKQLMDFYFGDKYTNSERIVVICADLQKDKFGLSSTEYDELQTNVNTVVNCAASVKHYGSYKYFYEVNVETTKRLIDFCEKSNAKLIHTSTLSVSGNSFGDEFDGTKSKNELHFYESSLYIGQPLENVYARSKFEAEKAVFDAMAKGLKANVMRMGNLTNRTDGKFQKNYESNAFLKRVKGVIDLGVFPDYLVSDSVYSEFTPVDEAAEAVMSITRHFSTEQTVFHINSIKVVYMDKLTDIFNKLGIPMKIVDGGMFTEILKNTAKQTGFEDIFETFINDMDENDRLNYESNIHIKNEFTVEYLKLLGFKWSDIGIEYMRKYVDYFKKIGYLK